MKKFFYSLLITIAAFFIISCDNLIEKDIDNNKSDLPVVSFSINGIKDSARMAIPENNIEDLEEISLKCYYPATNESEDTMTWKTDESSPACKKFRNAHIYLPYEGDWQFILTAKKNSLVYKSSANQKIKSNSNNIIEFRLALSSDIAKEGKGDCSVKVSFEKSNNNTAVNSVKAVLYKMKDNFLPGDKVDEKTLTPDNNAIVFEKKVDTGYYIADFSYYYNTDNSYSIKLGSKQEYIVIRAGETSKSELKIRASIPKSINYYSKDLKTFDNSSTFKELSEIGFIKNKDKYPYYYSNYTYVDLLEPVVPGYRFDGWYTTEKYEDGTKVTSTSELDKSKNDILLYAKWTQTVKIKTPENVISFKPMEEKVISVDWDAPEDVQFKKVDFVYNYDDLLNRKYDAAQKTVTFSNKHKFHDFHDYKKFNLIPYNKPYKIELYAENEEGIVYKDSFYVSNELTDSEISVTLPVSSKAEDNDACFKGLDTLELKDYYILKMNLTEPGTYVVQNMNPMHSTRELGLFAFDSNLNRLDEDVTDEVLSIQVTAENKGIYYLITNYGYETSATKKPIINLYKTAAIKSLSITTEQPAVYVGKTSKIEFTFEVESGEPEIDFKVIEPNGFWYSMDNVFNNRAMLTNPQNDFIYVSGKEYDVATGKGTINISGLTPGTVEITLRDPYSGLSKNCSVTCSIDPDDSHGIINIRECSYEANTTYGRNSGQFDSTKKAYIWKLDQEKDYQKFEKGKIYTFDNENKLNPDSAKPTDAYIFALYGYSAKTGKYTLVIADETSFNFKPEEEYDLYYYIARVNRKYYTEKNYTGWCETYVYRQE